MEELSDDELAQFIGNWEAILDETPLKFEETRDRGTEDEVDVYIYWPDHYEDEDFAQSLRSNRALLALLESFSGEIYEMVTMDTGVSIFTQELPEHEVTKFASMITSKIEKIKKILEEEILGEEVPEDEIPEDEIPEEEVPEEEEILE